MVAVENNLHDELLSELEFGVTPSKLSDNIRVDLYNLDNSFMQFLIENKHIDDGVHNDVQHITASKFPKFCQTIRDAFRVYNMKKNANV